MDLLRGPLKRSAEDLSEVFRVLEEEVRLCQEHRSHTLALVSGVVLAKAYRLGIGVCSLQLDALGQESGALLRPLQEVWELLTYLRLDPTRTDEILNGRLPPAGKIAQRVGARFKPLRDYLNDHASHFSFTWDSIRHFLHEESGLVQLSRKPEEEVLQTNLMSLTAILVLCAAEGAEIIAIRNPVMADPLMRRLERVRDHLTERQNARGVTSENHDQRSA